MKTISIRILKEYEHILEYLYDNNKVGNRNRFINEAIDFYIKFKTGNLILENNNETLLQIQQDIKTILNIITKTQNFEETLKNKNISEITENSEQSKTEKEVYKHKKEKMIFTNKLATLFEDD